MRRVQVVTHFTKEIAIEITLCDYHVAIAHREMLNSVQGPIRFYEHSFDIYVNSLCTPTTK